MNKYISYIISIIIVCSSLVDLTNHNTQIDPLEPSDYNKVSLYIGDKPIYKPFVFETGFIDEPFESRNQCIGSLFDISYLFLIILGLFAIKIVLISIQKECSSAPIGDEGNTGGPNDNSSGPESNKGYQDSLDSDNCCYSSGIDSDGCDSDSYPPADYGINSVGPISNDSSDEPLETTNSSINNNNSDQQSQQINNNNNQYHNNNDQINNNNKTNTSTKRYNNNYKSKYKKYNYYFNKRKTKLTSAKYINNYE